MPRCAWNSWPSARGLRRTGKALGPSMAMFIGGAAPVHPPVPMTGQTMSEKVLARASHAESVRPGQIIDGDVDLLYMHEMLALALLPFNEIGTMKVWVPETMRVDIHGTLGDRTGAKDVILKVIGTTGDDAARYAAVEFTGPTVDAFPMNERFVLCNMTTEMGAKVGMIAADDVTKEYLAHSGHEFEPIRSDDDATFLRTFAFDVDGMGPQVACPSNPANLKPVEDVAGTKIDVAFLGSCTNARIEDLRIAAELLRGERVAPGVRFQITPASQIIYRQALKEGLVEVFMDAGATFTSSTCGPCFGGHLGTLAGDEVCISSTNRNYPGRMGSPTAQVYLASPWTVTASAIHGEITDPRKV